MDEMTQSKSAAAQSWLVTSDAVLRGLNHEFSSRLSLARLAPQLSAMLAAGEPGMQKLADDAGRSEDLFNLLRLYRLMVFTSNEPSEPLLVSDVVGDAVALFKHHSTFRDLDVQVNAAGTIPPVLMNPGALTQAVLLLISATARQLDVTPGDTGTIVLGFSADTDAVRISAQAADAGHYAATGELPELPALRYLIRDVEGAADVTRGGATMSIGTLVRLRQREKRG
jgi:nitrogen-specific signal transduction histidine kinase